MQAIYRPRPIACLGLLAAVVPLWADAGGAEPPRAVPQAPAATGYSDFAALRQRIEELDRSDHLTVTVLAKTAQQREVYLLTIAPPGVKPDDRPAILIIGNVHAPHLAGGEMAMKIARQLVVKAGDEKIKPLLERFTFYIIPRPSPDAAERFFRKPRHENAGNARTTDDDRDGKTDEDGPDDLNGDGEITMMRVEDPAGEWIPHPDDPRVLIKADPLKKERGKYKLYTEGRDDDKDGEFNEDGLGGVDFNRNFTFQYPYFKPGAGPHQVSEPETRAIADFCFDHPNIAAVIAFTPEDNLFNPWKPGQDGRIKTNIQGGDAPMLEHVAKLYREIHGGKDAPGSSSGEGSFSAWAYFHYGRWSFAARGWWLAKVDKAEKGQGPVGEGQGEKPKPVSGNAEGVAADDKRAKDGKKDEKKDDKDRKDEKDKKDDPIAKPQAAEVKPPGDDAKPQAAKKGDEARGGDDLNALRWLAQQKIDGFVEWKAFDHPDFPGKKVEIGGFKPYVLLNPPVAEIDALTDKHVKWLTELADLMPRLAISETKVEPLGAGVYRLTVTVTNAGFMPTMSEMGRLSRQAYPVQLKIELPAGAKLIQSAPRTTLEPIKGGGRAEHTWLIQAPAPGAATLRVWAPSVGAHELTVELKEAK